MENDENRTNLVIIFVLLGVVVLVSIIVIVNHFLVKNNNKGEVFDDSKYENTSITDTNSVTVYNSYKIGEAVTLTDSSSWHVIDNSSVDSKFVLLLKDQGLEVDTDDNDTLLTYFENNYLNEIINTLNCNESDVVEARLLSKDDLENITSINRLDVDTTITNDDYNWLYSENTLTNMMIDNGDRLSICREGNTAKLCVDSSIKIRPVIKINKNYLQ